MARVKEPCEATNGRSTRQSCEHEVQAERRTNVNHTQCGQIATNLDQCGAALNDLTNTIDELERKLEGVLIRTGSGESVDECDPRAVHSPMAERAREMFDRILDANNRLSGIIDRLEC